MKKQNKIYVVFKGRKPGIYATWAEAESEVLGYSGAVHRSYRNIDLAKSAFESGNPNFGVEGGDRNGDLAGQREAGMYYTVIVGRRVGIYNTVQEADYQVDGYPDGFYEVYNNYSQAELAIEQFFLGQNVQSTAADFNNQNIVR